MQQELPAAQRTTVAQLDEALATVALMQAGKNPIKQVAMAKNFSVDVCEKVTREAVQLFGGMGFMRESVVERLYRDTKILSIGGGTTEIMKELIAKQIRL